MWCAGVCSTNYNIAINSPLPSRDAILKNKHNKIKRQLSRVLRTCHSCVHCMARNQAHPWKRQGITCSQRRRPRPGFAIFRRIAPTCFFMCTIYCLCQSGAECCNLHKRSQHVDDEDEKNGKPQEYEVLDADCSVD